MGPKTTETYNALRKMLGSAEVGPDGRLPSERELAARLKVGRTMLRQVLAQLAAEGHVQVRGRQGYFVVDGGRVPCSWVVLRHPHPPHDWEVQPGMDPVPCPGLPVTEPLPDPSLTLEGLRAIVNLMTRRADKQPVRVLNETTGEILEITGVHYERYGHRTGPDSAESSGITWIFVRGK